MHSDLLSVKREIANRAITEHHLCQISEGNLQDGALQTQAQGRILKLQEAKKVVAISNNRGNLDSK